MSDTMEKLDADLCALGRAIQEHDPMGELLLRVNDMLAVVRRPPPGVETEGVDAEEFDANVDRLKACEHIADGDEGWESLRNECPSTAAVARLRDAYTLAGRDEIIDLCAKEVERLFEHGLVINGQHAPAFLEDAIDAIRALLSTSSRGEDGTSLAMTPASLPASDGRPSVESSLSERLRDRTTLRFMGNCKCGNCQLVPRPLLDEAIRATANLPHPGTVRKAVMRYGSYYQRSMAFADDDDSPLLHRVCQQRDGLMFAIASLDADKIDAALLDTHIVGAPVGSAPPSNEGGSMNPISSSNAGREMLEAIDDIVREEAERLSDCGVAYASGVILERIDALRHRPAPNKGEG